MPDGPWTKYQSQPDGPWAKYGQQTSAPIITPLPPSPPQPSLYQQAGQAMQDFGTGSLKGLGNTVSGISSAIHAIPVIGPKIIPDEGLSAFRDITRPQGTAQKLGYGAEQAAEFLIPGPAEEKAGALAAEHFPQIAKIAAPAARIGAQALDTALINKAQGGGFGTGAAAGALGGVTGEAVKIAAPKLVEHSLGIFGREMQHGQTPGEAVLRETSAITPGGIRREAGAKIGTLTKEMEGNVANAPGVGGVKSAVDLVDNEMKKALQRNSGSAYGKLQDIRNQLTTHFQTGQSLGKDRTAQELLDAKRGIGELVNSWNKTEVRGLQPTLQKVYGALDREIDALSPGNKEINQRISSLITAKKAARATELGRRRGLVSTLATRIGLPGVGSAAGYELGGRRGAIEGALAGAAIGSPSFRIGAARIGPGAVRGLKGLALQTDREPNQ